MRGRRVRGYSHDLPPTLVKPEGKINAEVWQSERKARKRKDELEMKEGG